MSLRCDGAVRRASQVDHEYHLAAMHLDRDHHGVQLQMVQRRLTPVGGPGPVERALRAYPPVRGAAFGPRADASGDVDSLLRFAAGVRADIDWRSMGARTPAEARASILGAMRRALGVGVQRLEVQLRLHRATAQRRFVPGGLAVQRAADAQHGDPLADLADDFIRRRPPRHGAHDRR